MSHIEPVRYCFYDNIAREPENGAERFETDLRFMIEQAIGCKPFYPVWHSDCWQDPHTVVIGVERFNSRTNDPRWYGVDTVRPIFSRRYLGLISHGTDQIYLNHYHLAVSAPHFHPIMAYPSRINPIVIQAAANDYLRKNRAARQWPRPITTVILGDMEIVAGYKPEIDDVVEEIFKRRGGSILLTTSPRTNRSAKAIRKRIHPWIKDWYIWEHSEDRPNPYAAYMGLADEIMVTSDSISMISDAMMSGKPVRVISGHDLDQFFPDHPDRLVKGGALLRNFIKQGGMDLFDDPATPKSAPKFNTGLEQAMQAIAAGVRRTALAIAPR